MSNAGTMSAIDAWIGRELKRNFDETLAEPVPAELTRLLFGFSS